MRANLTAIKQSNFKTVLRANGEGWLIGLVLVALGGWLQWRVWDGTLGYYIHPRFNLVVGISGLIILQLGGWQIWRSWQNRPAVLHGSSGLVWAILVGLVVAAGSFIPSRALESGAKSLTASSSGDSRTVAAALSKQDWQNVGNLNTEGWNLLDWSAALNDPERAEKLLGRPFDLSGFVVQPANASTGYFMIARFVVICCTADSSALRLPVVTTGNQELAAGQWVRIQGTLERNSNGIIIFAAGRADKIATPAQPYIYP